MITPTTQSRTLRKRASAAGSMSAARRMLGQPVSFGPSTLERSRAALSAHPLVVDTAIALFLAALSLLANLGRRAGARGPRSR